jgi:hypothetical protein
MSFFLKSLASVFFIALNLFSEVNFINPSTTPSGNPPDLSDETQYSNHSQITSDATGKHVYSIWTNQSIGTAQVAISSDYGVTWSNPTTTPPGTTSPSISVAGNVEAAQITADATGKYVYAIWNRIDADNHYIIQVAISSDYGVTWTNPTTTPTGITPNLSLAGQDAISCQITCDTTGKYVYAIWGRDDGSNNYIIQVSISSDYGISWIDPSSTPAGTVIPNLSVAGQHAGTPQITTDNTGTYVYAVWYRYDGSNYRIQVAISSDFGVNWSYPPSGANISQALHSAQKPQITTDAAGQNVYAIWTIDDLSGNMIIQVGHSLSYGTSWSADPVQVLPRGIADDPQITTDDTGTYIYAIWSLYFDSTYNIQMAWSFSHGVVWHSPSTTPSGTITPNISVDSTFAQSPQITTDSSGQHVYATWSRANSSSKDIIQVALSSDFGNNWGSPTTTPDVTPNLSLPNGNALEPEIITNASGDRVYVIWDRSPGRLDLIQVAITSPIGPNNLLNVSYKNYRKELLLQRDYVNELFWNNVASAAFYRVYYCSLNHLIFQGNEMQFIHHGASNPSKYFISWVDSSGNESIPVEVNIPKWYNGD